MEIKLNESDRIGQLEKRVDEQNGEILILKSSLADVLKRLRVLEQTGFSSSMSVTPEPSLANIPLPQKSLTTIRQHNSSPFGANRSAKLKSDTGKSLSISTDHGGPSGKENRPRASASATKVNESSVVINTKSSASRLSSRSSIESFSANGTHQKFSFNKETGIVKFFLRGRPINLYIPGSYITPGTLEFKFDTEAKVKAPAHTLKLDWVYGYRGKDCRSNLFRIATGEIVYFIAAVVVIYNPEQRTQRHYLGHNDDIKSIAVHPNRTIIASGQLAGHDKKEGRPHVRVWDSVTLETLRVIGLAAGDFNNSISCLAFSRSGDHLAVVDEGGNDRYLTIWNWQQQPHGQKLATSKCHSDLVVAVEFHPTEKNLIVTCGKQHITFWNFDAATCQLTKRMGIFELLPSTPVLNSETNIIGSPTINELRYDKPKFILSIAFTSKKPEEIITGDSDGNLLFWNHKDGRISKVIKNVNDGGVFSVLPLESDEIVTGGKDGKLVLWENNDGVIKKSDKILQIPDGGCRVIAHGGPTASWDSLLIGTLKNCIYHASFETKELKCLVNGHYEELWGLSVHNEKKNYFMTCGNDRWLSLWDAFNHSNVWSTQLEEKAHCVCIHPKLEVAVVGSVKSKWFVLDMINKSLIFSSQVDSNEQIEQIKYSPSGSLLAVASRDNSIYMYSSDESASEYTRLAKYSGHSSFVTHIDWSSDSKYLMSQSGDYETLYWDVSSGKQLTNIQQIREIEWSSQTCTLTFNTLGIWHSKSILNSGNAESLDGTDINACHALVAKSVLVSCDDFGHLNLFKYPCNAFNAEKKVYSGHSSHVTNVAFLKDEKTVISTGGNDMAIFQWSLLDD